MGLEARYPSNVGSIEICSGACSPSTRGDTDQRRKHWLHERGGCENRGVDGEASDGDGILARLREADRRTLIFQPLGIGGELSPEDSARFITRLLERATLHPDVPDDVQGNFERVRLLFQYGVLEYEFFTAAFDAAHLVLEGALRHRFVSHYENAVPAIVDGAPTAIAAPSFDAYRKSVLALRGAGKQPRLQEKKPEGLPLGLTELWAWARRRGLLFGQRNVGVFGSITELRNYIAHPERYTLGSPVDAIGMLSDVAEIINRLWGHDTEGGRLFPAPVARRYRCAAISADGTHTMTFGSIGGVPLERDTAGWQYAVFLAADSEDLTGFDWSSPGHQQFTHQPGFQLTTLPTELVWGPGSHAELTADFSRFDRDEPVDHVAFLDRLFFIRTLNGTVELPRSAADVIDLADGDENAQWCLMRADFPLDAFVFVRDDHGSRDDVFARATVIKRLAGDAAARRAGFAVQRDEAGR